MTINILPNPTKQPMAFFFVVSAHPFSVYSFRKGTDFKVTGFKSLYFATTFKQWIGKAFYWGSLKRLHTVKIDEKFSYRVIFL